MELINKREHLILEGIEKIINIRASMNKKLIRRLNKDFPNIKPINESFIKIVNINDPQWITRFVEAEGCFYIKPIKDQSGIVKYSLVFSISQHSRDLLLMNKIIEYLKCGLIEQPSKRKEVRLVVYKFNDHYEKKKLFLF